MSQSNKVRNTNLLISLAAQFPLTPVGETPVPADLSSDDEEDTGINTEAPDSEQRMIAADLVPLPTSAEPLVLPDISSSSQIKYLGKVTSVIGKGDPCTK